VSAKTFGSPPPGRKRVVFKEILKGKGTWEGRAKAGGRVSGPNLRKAEDSNRLKVERRVSGKKRRKTCFRDVGKVFCGEQAKSWEGEGCEGNAKGVFSLKGKELPLGRGGKEKSPRQREKRDQEQGLVEGRAPKKEKKRTWKKQYWAQKGHESPQKEL